MDLLDPHTTATDSTPNGTKINLIDEYDEVTKKKFFNPQYEDYEVIFNDKVIGRIRRMYGGTKREYWIILNPNNMHNMYPSKFGAKNASDAIVKSLK